jgi:hypothetical protein
MMNNFTATDIVQITVAIFVFAIFFLPPGYILGASSNLLNFRRQPPVEKFLISAAFSTATVPILAVLLTRFFSYRITLAVLLLSALFVLVDVARKAAISGISSAAPSRSTWIALSLLLAWYLVVVFSLCDVQIGQHLYVSYVAYDQSVRVPFVEAAARTGVPPLNPFFGLGKPPVLRYYYYWYVVCALPMRLLGLGARACLDASVFWSGLGLASCLPLFLKHFLGEKENLRRKSLVAFALLTVTGLDLIPYAAMAAKFHRLPGDMEWWDPNQVTSWIGSFLWVPHHVAALTACMAGLLTLCVIREEQSLTQRSWAVAASALAFASATGLSVYVTFTFAIFLILWAFWILLHKKIKIFFSYVATGAITALLSWPFLQDLLGNASSAGASGGTKRRFVFFALRRFDPAFEVLSSAGVKSALVLRLLDIPLLVLVYVFEFGFFLFAMLLFCRADARKEVANRQRPMAWMMLISCIVTMSFVQSDTTGSNDLGFRGILIAQFVLLIWSVTVTYGAFFSKTPTLKAEPMWIRVGLVGTLILGVAGTVFQVAALRLYAPLTDRNIVSRSERFLGAPGFGERTYWLRTGYSKLNTLTPPTASIQYNPFFGEAFVAHLYLNHQAVVGDYGCGSDFGADPQKCTQPLLYFAAAFNRPEIASTWDIDAFCREFQVDVLVATDADPVWRDVNSWVWTRAPLYANPAMRAVSCGH